MLEIYNYSADQNQKSNFTYELINNIEDSDQRSIKSKDLPISMCTTENMNSETNENENTELTDRTEIKK